MQSSCDPYDVPPELCVKPLALVGVSGLDTVNNAVHKSIWETFSSNRRLEREPVLFKLIDNAHEFPVLKPKRNSYDWYIPKGILKKNWMAKHLYKIPAVMVIFYDLDWNDTQWNEKMIECVSRVQSMRAALDGRNTRITVVLIQNTPPLPAGDDVLASERGVALCASCELNAKSLFVLPHVDHLQGYAVRLESAFYDLAQNYYHMEAKNVKAHRDHLNKTTHQYLLVRHQFKMGFLYELKQDNDTAYKHYVQAYNYLLDIRIVDTNATEIRTVAGFINYKLCKLMFTLSLPRDSISQFKAHVDRFKNRIGFQELAFEHFAWLSKQYNIFGDIFDEAVKSGLPAVQTQHPGIYYQQSADYAVQRKISGRELCSNATQYPQPDPLAGIDDMEFYGQRPWRPGKISSESPDPQVEQNGIRALQYLEKHVPHSSVIISLYGLAISQYKTYRCPRMRRYLVLKMAEEYYDSEDYGKALTLLTHMLWDFRSEKWWQLLTQILVKALNCAYLVANVQDYVLLSLELLGSSVTISEEDKQIVFDNLTKVLQKQVPNETPTVPQLHTTNASILWQTAFNEQIKLSLDMSSIESCIDTKARFLQAVYEADEDVTVELYVTNLSSHSLTFSRISVTINTPDLSSEFAVNDSGQQHSSLTFKGNELKRFVIEVTPEVTDVGKEIQISSINLLLGQPTGCLVDLRFSSGGSVSNNVSPELLHFKIRPKDVIDFDSIKPLASALIVPRKSNLNVEITHQKPALIGEWYPIAVSIVNKESFAIKNVVVEAVLVGDEYTDSTEFSTDRASTCPKPPLQIKINGLQNDSSTKITFYIRNHKTGSRNVQVKTTYFLVSTKQIASVTEETVEIPVEKPLDVAFKHLSTLCQNIYKLYIGEEFAVMPIVKSLSPWPIVIARTGVEFVRPVVNCDPQAQSQLSGKTLKRDEGGAEMFLAKIEERHTEQLPFIGNYTIQWKRCNGELTTTVVPVPSLPIDWIPLYVKMQLPAYGFVRTPLLVTYEFHNRSHQLVQLDVAMEASEAFMFAGYKQFQISILPESVKELKYNLYPLIAGSVVIPKITLTVPEDATEGPALRQEQLKHLVDRCLPTRLFVMPQVKGSPDILFSLNNKEMSSDKLKCDKIKF